MSREVAPVRVRFELQVGLKYFFVVMFSDVLDAVITGIHLDFETWIFPVPRLERAFKTFGEKWDFSITRDAYFMNSSRYDA
jgi:hypothetical protein